MRKIFLALAIVSFSVSGASADFVGDGLGFTIPDDGVAASSQINAIAGMNEVITDMNVTLTGLNHTWMGDLEATLSGPGGSMELFFRVGDVSGTSVGDSTDFNGTYTFADGGGDLWGAAAALGADVAILSGTYAPTGATGTATSFFDTFGGSLANGVWTLQIRDAQSEDMGFLGSWTLDLTTAVIPEPTSTGLMGLALLGLGLRRRRKQKKY